MRPDRSRIPGRELAVQVGGDRLVVWLDPGVASALDARAVAEGRDVGATGVFVPVADGREVSFERSDDAFVDDKTGSRSNVLGHAVAGHLAGAALEPVVHVDTFWFAWGAFQPDTRIVP